MCLLLNRATVHVNRSVDAYQYEEACMICHSLSVLFREQAGGSTSFWETETRRGTESLNTPIVRGIGTLSLSLHNIDTHLCTIHSGTCFCLHGVVRCVEMPRSRRAGLTPSAYNTSKERVFCPAACFSALCPNASSDKPPLLHFAGFCSTNFSHALGPQRARSFPPPRPVS